MLLEKKIGSQVKITGTSIVGTLIKKGFIIGNFMYTVQTAEGAQYNVYQVESI